MSFPFDSSSFFLSQWVYKLKKNRAIYLVRILLLYSYIFNGFDERKGSLLISRVCR